MQKLRILPSNSDFTKCGPCLDQAKSLQSEPAQAFAVAKCLDYECSLRKCDSAIKDAIFDLENYGESYEGEIEGLKDLYAKMRLNTTAAMPNAYSKLLDKPIPSPLG